MKFPITLYLGVPEEVYALSVILRHRLFRRGALLEQFTRMGNRWYTHRDTKWPVPVHGVAIAYDGEKAIGTAVLCYANYTLQVFVNRKYRRQGVGTELVNTLVTMLDYAGLIYVDPHNVASDAFFAKVVSNQHQEGIIRAVHHMEKTNRSLGLSDIRFQTYKGYERVYEASKIIQKHKLRESGGGIGQLTGQIVWWEAPGTQPLKDERGWVARCVIRASGIVIAFNDRYPVGCALKYRDEVQVYVHHTWRRMGIGTKLISKLMESMNATRPVKVHRWSEASIGFWDSLNLNEKEKRTNDR